MSRGSTKGRKPRRPPRPSNVVVVQPGANREVDWTPLPPDERSLFPKYVEVTAGARIRDGEVGPDGIRVAIQQADKQGEIVHVNIYVQNPGRRHSYVNRDAYMEGVMPARQAAQMLDALALAVQHGRKLGILPEQEPSVRVKERPFTYTGTRGAAGVALDQ